MFAYIFYKGVALASIAVSMEYFLFQKSFLTLTSVVLLFFLGLLFSILASKKQTQMSKCLDSFSFLVSFLLPFNIVVSYMVFILGVVHLLQNEVNTFIFVGSIGSFSLGTILFFILCNKKLKAS